MIDPVKGKVIPMRPRAAATAGMSPSPLAGRRMLPTGQLVDIGWLRDLCGRMRKSGLPIDLAAERARRRSGGTGGDGGAA